MHENLTASGKDLEAEKVTRNRVRGRGCSPGHTPKKVGLAKSRLLGRLVGREEENEADDIMGDLAYRKRKGGSAKARKEILTLLGEGLNMDKDWVIGVGGKQQ